MSAPDRTQAMAASTVDLPALQHTIDAATAALLACQRGDGHWLAAGPALSK